MIQIEEYRADLTARVTKELEPELASLGSRLQPAMSKWTDGPDYVQLARVGEGEESPMIQGTIAGLEARMMFDLKETKSLREIKVDDTSHDSVSEGKASKYKRRQAQKYEETTCFYKRSVSDNDSLGDTVGSMLLEDSLPLLTLIDSIANCLFSPSKLHYSMME